MARLSEQLTYLVEWIEELLEGDLNVKGANLSSFLRTRAQVPYLTYVANGDKGIDYHLFFFKFEESKKGVHWKHEDGIYTFVKQETAFPAMEIDSKRLEMFLGSLAEVTTLTPIEGESLMPQEVMSGSHPVGMIIRKMKAGKTQGIIGVGDLKGEIATKMKALISRMFDAGDEPVSAPVVTAPAPIPAQSIAPTAMSGAEAGLLSRLDKSVGKGLSIDDAIKREASRAKGAATRAANRTAREIDRRADEIKSSRQLPQSIAVGVSDTFSKRMSGLRGKTIESLLAPVLKASEGYSDGRTAVLELVNEIAPLEGLIGRIDGAIEAIRASADMPSSEVGATLFGALEDKEFSDGGIATRIISYDQMIADGIGWAVRGDGSSALVRATADYVNDLVQALGAARQLRMELDIEQRYEKRRRLFLGYPATSASNVAGLLNSGTYSPKAQSSARVEIDTSALNPRLAKAREGVSVIDRVAGRPFLGQFLDELNRVIEMIKADSEPANIASELRALVGRTKEVASTVGGSQEASFVRQGIERGISGDWIMTLDRAKSADFFIESINGLLRNMLMYINQIVGALGSAQSIAPPPKPAPVAEPTRAVPAPVSSVLTSGIAIDPKRIAGIRSTDAALDYLAELVIKSDIYVDMFKAISAVKTKPLGYWEKGDMKRLYVPSTPMGQKAYWNLSKGMKRLEVDGREVPDDGLFGGMYTPAQAKRVSEITLGAGRAIMSVLSDMLEVSKSMGDVNASRDITGALGMSSAPIMIEYRYAPKGKLAAEKDKAIARIASALRGEVLAPSPAASTATPATTATSVEPVVPMSERVVIDPIKAASAFQRRLREVAEQAGGALGDYLRDFRGSSFGMAPQRQGVSSVVFYADRRNASQYGVIRKESQEPLKRVVSLAIQDAFGVTGSVAGDIRLGENKLTGLERFAVEDVDVANERESRTVPGPIMQMPNKAILELVKTIVGQWRASGGVPNTNKFALRTSLKVDPARANLQDIQSDIGLNGEEREAGVLANAESFEYIKAIKGAGDLASFALSHLDGDRWWLNLNVGASPEKEGTLVKMLKGIRELNLTGQGVGSPLFLVGFGAKVDIGALSEPFELMVDMDLADEDGLSDERLAEIKGKLMEVYIGYLEALVQANTLAYLMTGNPTAMALSHKFNGLKGSARR